MEKYDLIIIGGGPGGYEAALYASKKYNLKIALIEKDNLGGTCLNRGCIPTKTLLHTIQLYNDVKSKGNNIGIENTEGLSINLNKLQERKETVINQLKSGIEALISSNNISLYKGIGHIISNNEVYIETTDDKELVIEGERILVSTGSYTSIPNIKGIYDNNILTEGILTSNELLDFRQPIRDLRIIGGGVIGCEFASLFASLGTNVTILEAMDRIIPGMDKEIGQSLKMIMKKTNYIDIHTKASVKEIQKVNNGLLCKFVEKGKPMEIFAEKVLIAIGRKPYTNNLFTKETPNSIKEIVNQNGAINVDENFCTVIKNIYAIGDVIGGIQLAHVAVAQGKFAVDCMVNGKSEINLDIIPSCLYVKPEIATVGMTLEQAKSLGISAKAKKVPMSSNGKTLLSMDERSFIKIIFNEESHEILGGQIMCSRATDMISQISLAISKKLTIEEFSGVIYPHPTFSESFGDLIK